MSLEPFPDAAIAFLSAARPSGFWVLVSIDPEAPSGDPSKARGATFAAGEPAAAREWIAAQNRDRNIYWTVNRVAAPLAKKPAKTDIAAMEFLHVDLDPDKRRPFQEERERLTRLVAGPLPGGLPEPTFLIDSGGGYQLFWRLEEPVTTGGRREAAEDAERWNRQLEAIFRAHGADACHNVDRIMRLPGTVNHPDSKKRATGRTPRLATLERSSAVAYPISAFSPAPKLQVAELSLVEPRADVETGNVVRLLSIDELPDSVAGGVKVVIVQGCDPDNPRRWPSRSEPLLWVCCEMVRAGVPDDVIYSVITDPGFGISESVLDKGSRAEKYALKQITHAHECVEDPRVAELNKRHAVIGDVGGKCRVISETFDPVLGRDVFSIQAFEDIRNRYSNRIVPLETKESKEEGEEPRMMELGLLWLQSPRRRQFDRMVFAPGRTVSGAYNLWRGFDCEAIPGDCSLYLRHALENVCGGNEAHYEYLLSWMAKAVQNPDEQAHTAIVMRGARGVGKGVIATNFGELFGRHFFPITSPGDVFGDFNEHLLDTVVLFADEAFFAGDKRNEAVLKGLITERRRVARAKFRAAEATANCLHIIMAANEDWVVPAGPHERRYFVLQAGENHLQDKPYFRAIQAQMDSGGREALLHLLLNRDLSKFDPREVPHTAALQEQKEHSLSLEQEWWYGKLRAGQIRDGEEWPAHVPVSEIQVDFARYAQQWGRGHRLSAPRLARVLERSGARRARARGRMTILTEEGLPRSVDRPRVFSLPPLAEARAAWERSMGGEFDWTADEEVDDGRPTDEPFS